MQRAEGLEGHQLCKGISHAQKREKFCMDGALDAEEAGSVE